MHIRHALPDDLTELRRMGAAFHDASCYLNTVERNLDSFESTLIEIITSKRGVVLVAEDEAHGVCGMAAAITSPHWFNHSHKVGQEMFWWVDPCARGSRAGHKLMQGLEDWAVSVGCKTFCMASTANLTPDKLAKFYIRRGYVPQDIYYAKVIQNA